MRNLFWLTLFTLVAFTTITFVSFQYGKISGQIHDQREVAHYKARYDRLAKEADWLTEVSAAGKEQQEARK